jgi:hypothetical protein
MAISTIGLLYVWLAAEKCESIKASSETIEIICLVMITDPSRRALGPDAQTATMTWNCIHFKRMTPGRRLSGVRLATIPGSFSLPVRGVLETPCARPELSSARFTGI